jgi:NADP-dependent 3-hydroxy acid dehydrogenase YdfG
MSNLAGEVVFVTGASSGIGAACARAFSRVGARLLLAARRESRLKELEGDLGRLGAAEVRALTLDVRSEAEVSRALNGLPDTWKEIGVLVNNAGLSRGLDPLPTGDLRDWNEMIDTNIKGLLHVDRVVAPWMVRRGRGTIIHIGSVAGRQVYPGGAVYCATKHAVRALTDGLRIDLLGSGVRVCSIDPGMVETEFSLVRFHGDERRAAGVYDGMTPLAGDDVAEAALFVATRPAHVNIAEMLVFPTDQASATHVHRET